MGTPKLDIYWPRDGEPLLIVNAEITPERSFEHDVVKNGKKVVETSRVSFTVANYRPATAEEVSAWREQR
jgi:hypothetical protein